MSEKDPTMYDDFVKACRNLKATRGHFPNVVTMTGDTWFKACLDESTKDFCVSTYLLLLTMPEGNVITMMVSIHAASRDEVFFMYDDDFPWVALGNAASDAKRSVLAELYKRWPAMLAFWLGLASCCIAYYLGRL